MKAIVCKYIARHMLMTMIIRLESGEKVEVTLGDDLLSTLFGDHARVSYSFSGEPKNYVAPDKVTCTVENGIITKMIIETDGIETEE